MKGKGKRLFSLAIAFLLAVMAPISAFAAWVNPFTDVKPGAWHYEVVEYVNTNYLFSGTAADKFWPVKGSNGKLLPQRTDARAQTAQIFYNAHELLASPVVKLQAAGCFALSIRWYCLCWYCHPWSEWRINPAPFGVAAKALSSMVVTMFKTDRSEMVALIQWNYSVYLLFEVPFAITKYLTYYSVYHTV